LPIRGIWSVKINYRLAQLRKMYKVLANNLCVSIA